MDASRSPAPCWGPRHFQQGRGRTPRSGLPWGASPAQPEVLISGLAWRNPSLPKEQVVVSQISCSQLFITKTRLGESKAGARTAPELARPGHACTDPHAMTLSSPKLFPCIQDNVIASFLNCSNIWYSNCAQPTQNPEFVVCSAFELLHKVHKTPFTLLCQPLKSQTYDSSANNNSISEINKKKVACWFKTVYSTPSG